MSKRFADLTTALRALVAVALVLLGFRAGPNLLQLAVLLMMVSWISDYLDGTLARANPQNPHSWLGDHDLQIDMSAAVGLLVYLVVSGLLAAWWGIIYFAFWTALFARYGVNNATGSAMQAPIYGYFLWVTARLAPQAFWWVAAWIAFLLIFEWRRFTQQVIPEFLGGLADTFWRRKNYL